MENLLSYLLCALMGHNVTDVHVGESRIGKGKLWHIWLEDCVSFTLDEVDLQVIRSLYNERYEWLDEGERESYLKIFNACI